MKEIRVWNSTSRILLGLWLTVACWSLEILWPRAAERHHFLWTPGSIALERSYVDWENFMPRRSMIGLVWILISYLDQHTRGFHFPWQLLWSLMSFMARRWSTVQTGKRLRITGMQEFCLAAQSQMEIEWL